MLIQRAASHVVRGQGLFYTSRFFMPPDANAAGGPHATKFSRLLDDAADQQNCSLESVMLRAKVLAARFGSKELRAWIANELSGYSGDKDLPAYRRVPTVVLGDFWGPFGSKVINVRISTNGLDTNIRDLLEVQCFYDNIGLIEEMLASDSPTFHNHWPGNIVQFLRQSAVTRVNGHILQSVQSMFPKHAIRGVLQAIRSRLLDLLLGLRDEYPELEDSDKAVSGISPEFVGHLVQQVIYSNCTLVGDTNMSNNNIQARDIKAGRDLTISSTIRDSYNRVQESNVDHNTASLLNEFVKLIEAIHPQLDAATADQLVEDGKSLVAEAIKEKPRKTIAKAIGDSINSSVAVLGKNALPITLAIEKIVGMCS